MILIEIFLKYIYINQYHFLTFISVSILWIPFRSSTIEESFYVIKNIFLILISINPFGLFSLVKMLMLIVILLFIDFMIEKK